MTKYLLSIYTVVVAIGVLIYFNFPQSKELWGFLAAKGVIFKGDPHINRFISPYLDPNFYAVIACIPIIFLAHLTRQEAQFKYTIWTNLFILTILMSESRSGIATMFFVIVVTYRESLLKFVGSSLVLLLPLCPFYLDTLFKTVNRTINIDASAYARWTSFQLGWEAFTAHPILGIGFNYLSPSIDSSLLTSFATLGFILTSVLLIYIAKLIWDVGRAVKASDQSIFRLYQDLMVFSLFVLAFSSQFNNLMFYPFWLFPVIMTSSYIAHTAS